MMQRDEFLLNIKRKLETAVLPDTVTTLPPMPALEPFDPVELVRPFTNEVTALAGEVHPVSSAEEAVEAVLSIFARHNASTYISWDENKLPVPNLPAALEAANIHRQHYHLPAEKEARLAALAALSSVPVGITGITGAVAESGAIGLVSEPGNGRFASLLPPIHIAIMTTSQIVPTLHHFLAAHPEATTKGSNLVFIAGPSRTADIEMTLTIGVHGPKELHIVLIENF
jgi:L-lactate dehydrogenase complex protein LldG